MTLGTMQFTRRALLAAATMLLAVPAAAQQDYPNRDIRVICGYAPGSGADTITRFFAERLRQLAGKPVIVDNKPGALTAIGAEALKMARPDGYTIMITAGNSTMASNPYLFKEIKYDPIKDFAPITSLMTLPFVAGVAPNSPVNSIAELTALLKQKGDKASHGYSSSFALAGAELYQSMVGTNAIRVSYKSTPELMPDLLGGQLDFIFSDATFLLGQAASGRFKPLAVTTLKRSSVAPNLPSLDEAGVKGYELSAWWGAWAPAGTPQPIIEKLAGWLNQIVASDETREALLKIGGEPLKGDAKLLAEMTPREMQRWERVIKIAKIEPQ
jgi:tripartite-type tricarboxylate transporter receptor subunit TctC